MISRRLLVALLLLLFPVALCAAQNPAPSPATQSPAESPVKTAQQQFHDGQFAEAITTLQQALHSDPNHAGVYYWLGRCYYELGRFDQASDQLQQALKIDPDNSVYHLWLGRTDGRLADQKSSLWLAMRTRKEFEKAVKLDPKNIPARRDLSEFYTEAPWIVGGSKSKARQQIAAIAAIDTVQGALAQAEYDQKTGDLAGAQAEYRKVLEAGASRVEEYYEIADFYASRSNLAALREAVAGAIRVAPSDPRLGYYRGVVLALEGDQLPEAESYLKAYLAATPNRSDYPSHANARTWLGHVYEKQGKRLEAAEQYRAALEIDPDSDFAKRSLKQLEKQQVN
jgi:tetratricopeptide (TPR) repeat protein